MSLSPSKMAGKMAEAAVTGVGAVTGAMVSMTKMGGEAALGAVNLFIKNIIACGKLGNLETYENDLRNILNTKHVLRCR